jgi:hypothetical protein
LHSDENPFGGYDRIKKDLKGRSEEQILVRAYGYPVRSITALLPKFSTTVNVLSDEPNKYGHKLPDIRDRSKYTIYQVVDPAGARNFVSLWAAVDAQGCVYIVREWPDRGSYGEWAIFGDPKWKYGPASKKIGHDVKGYSELFKEIEQEMGVVAHERIGDSRYFARENENNVDLFQSFSDYDMDFIPSSGQMEKDGIVALDEWFEYNEDGDIDLANRPRCYISSECGNLIDSLINYQSNGKADEALKDFFDLIRYLRMANGGLGPDHFTNNSLESTKVGSGGY